MPTVHAGGCFCGAARYRVEGAPIDAGYCHCRICQRTAGAPVVAWGSWEAIRVAWDGAEPATLASSVAGRRRFCAACGTHLLFWTSEEPGIVDVNLATLDLPELVPPEYHIWTASRIPWLETADALPRYPDSGIDTPEHRRRRP
jgi:hypothetical protein